jgi:hypothetical protein
MFRHSEKGLRKTPRSYFSHLIQKRLKSINVVSSDVSFGYQSDLERQQSILIFGSPEGEAKSDDASYKMRLNIIIMTGLTRTLNPKVIRDSMNAKMQQGSIQGIHVEVGSTT